MLLLSKMSLLPLFALLVIGKENYAPLSPARIYERQLMTCNQTYGQDSVVCGGADSTFCYSPTAGQTCCADQGFCGKGSFCAPVAGFCCVEGEDLATCAQNAGFTLPTTSGIPGATTIQPASSPSSIDVSAFLSNTAQASPTIIFSTPATESGSGVQNKPSNSNILSTPTSTQVSNTTTPPFVQVAVAAKAHCMAVGSATVAGITLVLAVLW